MNRASQTHAFIAIKKMGACQIPIPIYPAHLKRGSNAFALFLLGREGFDGNMTRIGVYIEGKRGLLCALYFF